MLHEQVAQQHLCYDVTIWSEAADIALQTSFTNTAAEVQENTSYTG